MPFTATELPDAVRRLLELNHYRVEGPVQVNGAEIDLVATPLGDPFASPMYIEVTIQYVNNDKYGKDLTKLQMVREMDSSSRCLIISSTGFTIDVQARAASTRITTLTYDELFAHFERFDPYVQKFVGEGADADEVRALDAVYQMPRFADAHGSDPAVAWLDHWVTESTTDKSWLIIVGEYGTGKTALTRVLQYRWLQRYKSNPSAPIPIRIELGNFTRQFDAQGLLHHFLDSNRLGHVPIDFLWSLIRSGRVVLLLDGYDEMAQYLNQRERRECLKTLAQLTSGGARGMLTSRPNYFSETEEFALFDHLYRSLELRSGYLADRTKELQQRESDIDDLIVKSLLERYERSLEDLSPDQTEALVRQILHEESEVADVVIDILKRVFRTTEEGNTVALSGKPVIIGYLVQVAASLRGLGGGSLSEWEVYTLVLDQLALRDLEQAGRVTVEERRQFLQFLAIWLSESGLRQVDEAKFRELISDHFTNHLRKYRTGQRDAEIENYFEDLRRSGTLSRAGGGDQVGWRFSHNSLREFLVAERMVEELQRNRPLQTAVPVTDAMRTFVASQDASSIEALVSALTDRWSSRLIDSQTGSYLSLIWDAGNRVLRPTEEAGDNKGEWSLLKVIAGDTPAADGVQMTYIDFSAESRPTELRSSNFSGCALSYVGFDAANLSGSNFDDSLLDAVSFRFTNLSTVSFNGALLNDISITGADLQDADFTGTDPAISIILDDESRSQGPQRLVGEEALGYLRYHGAKTINLESIRVLRHAPEFLIVEKIATKLLERSPRQRLGLEQRGIAAQNPKFARAFVDLLESERYVSTPLGRTEVVEITSEGRAALGAIVAGRSLGAPIEALLRARS
jgi:hypothetical protein